MTNIQSSSIGKSSIPRLGWDGVFLHLMLAATLSWLLHAFSGHSMPALSLVNNISSIIPSIEGMADNSPSPDWARIYLLACWIGVPFYLMRFWAISSYALREWMLSMSVLKFLFTVTVSFATAAAIYFLPTPNDGEASLKATAALERLMKDNYVIFGIVSYSMILGFAMSLAVSVNMIFMRYFK